MHSQGTIFSKMKANLFKDKGLKNESFVDKLNKLTTIFRSQIPLTFEKCFD